MSSEEHTGAPTEEATYDLPLSAPRAGQIERELPDSLPGTILVRNVRWFCQLRWLVTAILLLVGIAAWLPGLAGWMRLRERIVWPFVLAAVLVVENSVFLIHARRLTVSSLRQARWSLWGQILVDLLVLTVVVHYSGSMETYIHFAYLFHIVLACIFLPRRASLAVTVMACVFYGLCVLLEETGLWPPTCIFADPALRGDLALMPGLEILNFVSTLGILLVVWYLASHLSAMVRRRDRQLDGINRRLVQAREERVRHMLHTTHELKAPFAAIHANAQLLLKGYCGELSQATQEVVERISARSRRLADEIQEMLQLANLSSQGQRRLERTTFDVGEVLRWCISQVQTRADERNIQIRPSLRPAETTCVAEHLKMLFTNLLSNAVAYSREGGEVRVRCERNAEDRPIVVVEDDGIGIEPEKLPNIFKQYYRTAEAARHNKESSGLGLAVVQHIARTHSLPLRVRSRAGRGTQVRVTLPAARAQGPRSAKTKEPQHGVRTDPG